MACTDPNTTRRDWLPTSPSPSSTLHRALGDSEYAFFKNSSTGLGDMFLHLAFRAPRDMMRRERVCIAWCMIRALHPLLMSKVALKDINGLSSPTFCFTPPASVQDALDATDRALHYRSSTKDELIFDYMNGPRTLSNDRLSYLVISHPNAVKDDEYSLFMCAPHFVGDGTSLHQSTHDLLLLLASPKSDTSLRQDLESQLQRAHSLWPDILPPACESRLSAPCSPLARAASQVNFLQTKQREIGDHVFPRAQRGAQSTRLVEHAFSKEHTRAILSACKRNSVSVNNALFALCNVAWARMSSRVNEPKLPMMIYSAINLRPYLSPPPISPSTYWFLALTYFTVVLPSFPPASPPTFWHRARLTKAQTTTCVKSRFLPSRALFMATQRAGTRMQDSMPSSSTAAAPPNRPQLPPQARARTPAPSRALLGLSLIGNLDHTYTPASYARRPGIELHNVTTASRQREGGLLVLEHTFAERLWLHLCWDEMGFEEGVIEEWWAGVVSGVEELMR